MLHAELTGFTAFTSPFFKRNSSPSEQYFLKLQSNLIQFKKPARVVEPPECLFSFIIEGGNCHVKETPFLGEPRNKDFHPRVK